MSDYLLFINLCNSYAANATICLTDRKFRACRAIRRPVTYSSFAEIKSSSYLGALLQAIALSLIFVLPIIPTPIQIQRIDRLMNTEQNTRQQFAVIQRK